MGFPIYTKKLSHPVHVTFTCEHCGQHNSFVQEIVGSSSAEVRYGSSAEQQRIDNLGPDAQIDLELKIQRAEYNIGRGNYSWLRVHRCTNCKYAQSWQTGRIWKRSIKFFVLDMFILLVFCSWFQGTPPASITSAAWGLFVILGILMLIPAAILIASLRKRDKETIRKPDVKVRY